MKLQQTLLHVSLLLLLPLIYYFAHYLQTTEEKNLIILQRLRRFVDASNTRIKSEILNISRRHFEKAVRSEIYNRMINELTAVILPGHQQEIHLKYELRSAIQRVIQEDLTKGIRSTMKQDIKEITSVAISKNLLADVIIKKYPTNLCSKSKKLPPHQKVLSYSVFGPNKMYYKGISKVLDEALASNLYHDWRIRIYHDVHLTSEEIAGYTTRYKNVDFCDARILPRYGDITGILGTLWRTAPMADESVDVVCFRDLDSSILTREEDAVREFLISDKMIHLMHDNPNHRVKIQGGMWGIKPMIDHPLGRKLFEKMLEQNKTYNIDQMLYGAVVYDGIADKEKYFMNHNAYGCKLKKGTLPFPSKRQDDREFIGCSSHGGCSWNLPKCPVECRPKNHQDWEYC